MNIENYRVFVKAIETGNITKASEILGYTQSGVSRIISKIEEEFGMPLVIRMRSGIILQKRAEPLLQIMKNIIMQENKLYESARILCKQEKETIKISTFHTVAVNVLPQILHEFYQENNSVNFDIIERARCRYIVEQLNKNEVDVGFVPNNESDETFQPLCKDYYYVIMNSDHPLVNEKVITEEMLQEHKFVIPDAACEDSRIQELIERIKNTENFVKIKSLDDAMTISMVQSGFGISIVSGLFFLGTGKKLIAKPLSGEYYRTIGICVSKKATENKAVRQFVSFVKKYYESHDEPTIQ